MNAVVRITGEHYVSLLEHDSGSTDGITEQQADTELSSLRAGLRELHEVMMAAETHALLVILQGMDAAGKDVTIENVFGEMNPQAFRVEGFKSPAGEEAKHHFLWRANAALPTFGEAVVFDRSYYEQAIRPRVEDELPEADVRKRQEHINAFERVLVESGTIIVKVFLNISKDVQEQRLEERQNDILTAWKVSGSDWEDRAQWDKFIQAYEMTLNTCASPDIPWYLVPADHHWFHNVAVGRILLDRLRPFRGQWEDARRSIGKHNQKEAEAARSRANQPID